MLAAVGLDDLPAIALAVATLVLLEGLLSADNALVLAVMVRHLPKPQQKRALRYGIWGAFLFRAIAVVFAYQLIEFWQFKVLGGLYLIYLAVKHFLGPEEHAEGAGPPRRSRLGSGFWATVVNVELADVAFSIDSILAGVAMVEGLPPNLQGDPWLSRGIIYLGGVLGIIMMRLVAGVFLVLLDRFHGLASGAYVLVGWIGLKLIGGGLNDAFKDPGLRDVGWRAAIPDWVERFPWEMSHVLFWSGMALIAAASLLYRPRGGHSAGDRPGPAGAAGEDEGEPGGPAGVAAAEPRGASAED
jgi:YkoY family integral membrane protein